MTIDIDYIVIHMLLYMLAAVYVLYSRSHVQQSSTDHRIYITSYCLLPRHGR